jgi:surfactin synthase thioesterase subunit
MLAWSWVPMADSLVRFFSTPKPPARAVVLAFPHAGGSASAYASWPARLPGWLDLCAFAAPGREGASGEPPCTSWPELAALAEQAAAELDLPLVLFGHSFGAWIAYDVAHRLAAAGRPPLHLFLAGARPPHLAGPPLARPRDERSLLAYVRALGGTSEDVLRDPELRDSLLSALRADFSAAAGYARTGRQALRVETTLFRGEDDDGLTPPDAARWRDLLGANAKIFVIPGGHFFVHDARNRVIATIISRLRPERS